MEQFQPLDISGDAGLRVFGRTLEEIFVNASVGLYSLITDLSLVKEEKGIQISAESSSLEGLLISWLNELIFQFDAYGFIGKEVTALEIMPGLDLPDSQGKQDSEKGTGNSNYRVSAVLSGEEFAPDRHEGKLLIKAATYHKLKVEKTDTGWQADIIFDI